MIMPHRLKSKFLANLSEMWQQNCCLGVVPQTNIHTNLLHVYILCLSIVLTIICNDLTFGFYLNNLKLNATSHAQQSKRLKLLHIVIDNKSI